MKLTLHLIFVLLSTSLVVAQPKLVPVTILHWNDFHAQNEPYNVTVKSRATGQDTSFTVGGTATLLGYLNKYRQESPNPLLFHAGDDFQGTPISSQTHGRSQIELLNLIKPDAFTLGNHEFDYGSEKLRSYFLLAQFPILTANVYDTIRKTPFAQPTRIIKTGGVTIGVMGLTHPELETLVIRDSLLGLIMLDIDSVATSHIREFRQQGVDLIVSVTHMGLRSDSLLAMNHPEIDVIVSGHDHVPLFAPKRVNRTIIIQAGRWGRYLGKLDLQVDIAGDSVYSYAGRLIETRTSDIVPDPVAEREVERLVGDLRTAMEEVIGELKTPWVRSPERRRSESNIGSWQTDVMRAYAKTDIAIQNSTGIRVPLGAGPIKVGDIWRMNPFGNYFVVFEVDGKTLRQMLEFQSSVSTQEWCQVSGVRYTFDSRKPAGQKVQSIEVGGNSIDESEIYTIVTNNYVTSNIPVHFGIDSKGLKFRTLPTMDRDVFIDAVRQMKTISSFTDGRIIDLGAIH
ncbi:MAG: bifunctional UDP-sugar hydrolase/5'-nucleotidase [Bacteroidota bacterium]